MVNTLSNDDVAEICKCSVDFCYFAKTYLNLCTDIDITTLQSVTSAVNEFTEDEMIALLTWQCLFENQQRMCITSSSQQYSEKILNQVLENCVSLPQFQAEIKSRRKGSAVFQNGNNIQIVSCNENSIRGMYLRTLIIFNSHKIPLAKVQKLINNLTHIFQHYTKSKLIMV